MIKIEEAINIIDIAIAEVEWCYPLEYAEAFEIAKNALEKQIGKKPRSVTVNELNIRDMGLCPTCKMLLTTDMQYCDSCGQKIDWTIEENADEREEEVEEAVQEQSEKA